MKKKQIEAVPWILPERKRFPKKILFVAAADVQEVSGEDHLIVDIWQKGRYEIPVLRAAYTKADWGLQYPQEEKWSREGICEKGWNTWNTLKACAPINGQNTSANRENTEISQASAEKIFRFVDNRAMKDMPWNHWINELEKQERVIEGARRQRAYDRRREALRQRQADTPEIPEAFKEWLAEMLKDTNFLYYRKKGRRVSIRCSHCGAEYEGYTRRLETYEGQFQHIIPNVENLSSGICECCGAKGMYRPIGRMKGVYGIGTVGYILQPYHEKDFVLRYFEYEKCMRTDSAEESFVYEIARVYVTPEKIQCDYHKAGMIDSYWDDCNLYGMNNIEMKKGRIWPGSWVLVKGTRCMHTGLKEYASRFRELKPARYLGEWKARPYLEVLAKCDLYKAAEATVEGRISIPAHLARRPADILGVYPYRMKMIREAYGDPKLISVLQMESKTDSHFTERQIRQIEEMNIAENNRTRMALEIMPVQKLINRIYRYAGLDPEDAGHCTRAMELLHQTASRYLDYLSMRQQAGDDLTDSIVQYPRDLNTAHDEMIRMINEHKEEMHIREKEKEFPNIRRRYRSLRKKYFWEDKAYIIRPARSAGEIILEGRTLHHCVGGDTYLRGHDSGHGIILFLRMKETPAVPYVTVEIDPNTNVIRQWYGIRDTKPDKKAISDWLADYVCRLLKYGTMSAAAAAIEETLVKNAIRNAETMRLLVAAAG